MTTLSEHLDHDGQFQVPSVADEADMVMAEFINMILGDFPDARDIRDLSDQELDEILVAMGNMASVLEV